ncbi:MAG: DUF4019 domain-containing protein [Endomicrobium sp.]|jgi:hypothetical protein|nr:DUF4019 domain-containing protein [Endomicrobium sp.]
MKTICAVAALFIAVFSGCAHYGEVRSSSDKSVKEACLSWLKLQDEYKYEEGYDKTAQSFRDNVKKEQWVSDLNSFRKPLGDFKKRKELDIKYENKMPNSPDGEYAIARYGAIFNNDAVEVFKDNVVIETVILYKENEWKVSGYWVK